MSRKFVIALVLVLVAAAGLVSVASGAGIWRPFKAPDHGQEQINLSLAETTDLQTNVIAQNLVQNEIKDKKLRNVDLDDDDPDDDPYCNGSAADLHPVGSKLAALFSVSYEEIMEWHCQGRGFGEIAIAYSISLDEDSNISVAELFTMRDEGKGWGEIMQELGYQPGDYPKKWKFMTPTMNWCNSDINDPKLIKLADKLGLTVEEVNQRLCDGVSIGALKMAARLATELDVPLDEVLTFRQSGMGWGKILKEYDKPPNELAKPVQSEERGKGNKFGLGKKDKANP